MTQHKPYQRSDLPNQRPSAFSPPPPPRGAGAAEAAAGDAEAKKEAYSQECFTLPFCWRLPGRPDALAPPLIAYSVAWPFRFELPTYNYYWLVPRYSPGGQGQQGNTHDEIGKVGKRVQPDQAEDAAQDVHHDGNGEVDGRRPGRLEDVFALVVRPERDERFVQVLLQLFAISFAAATAVRLFASAVATSMLFGSGSSLPLFSGASSIGTSSRRLFLNSSVMSDRRPSKLGLIATVRPGWGIRKQAISEKQDVMCRRSDCSSGCCLSDTSSLRCRITWPPSAPYSASYGKLQSRTRNCNRWNGFLPESASASRPYSVKS
uniref:Uncharacterized protein n=1 Tax=Anopheles atroparvus TaxID=41427 RepID=A0A182J1Q7_ANOAO